MDLESTRSSCSEKRRSGQIDDLFEPTDGLNRVGTWCPQNDRHSFVIFVGINIQGELCQWEHLLQTIVTKRGMIYLVDVLREIHQSLSNVLREVLNSGRNRSVKQWIVIELKFTSNLRRNRRVIESSVRHVLPSSSWCWSMDTDWKRFAVHACPSDIGIRCFHSEPSAGHLTIPWRIFELVFYHESNCVTREARVWPHCSRFDTMDREIHCVQCHSLLYFACVDRKSVV